MCSFLAEFNKLIGSAYFYFCKLLIKSALVRRSSHTEPHLSQWHLSASHFFRLFIPSGSRWLCNHLVYISEWSYFYTRKVDWICHEAVYGFEFARTWLNLLFVSYLNDNHGCSWVLMIDVVVKNKSPVFVLNLSPWDQM